MDDVLPIIQLLVAPVVMISASGLLCLALYARLAGIVGRSRGFVKEHFEEVGRLAALPENSERLNEAALHQQRIDILNEQLRLIMARARTVRAALFCLLSGVLCMLMCSLALGLMLLIPRADALALTFFFFGVIAMSVGIVLAMWELVDALEPLRHEQRLLSRPPSRSA